LRGATDIDLSVAQFLETGDQLLGRALPQPEGPSSAMNSPGAIAR